MVFARLQRHSSLKKLTWVALKSEKINLGGSSEVVGIDLPKINLGVSPMVVSLICCLVVSWVQAFGVGCSSPTSPSDNMGNELQLDVPAVRDVPETAVGDDSESRQDADTMHSDDGESPDHLPGIDVVDSGEPDTSTPADCIGALKLKCGDTFRHSTITDGRDGIWRGYNCTARAETGREVLYQLEAADECVVKVTLSELQDDLDLFLLPVCDPTKASLCSSTPFDIQTIETVTFVSNPDEQRFVVVDGYAEAQGNYAIRMDCDCSEQTQYKADMLECAFILVDPKHSPPTTPESAPCLPEPCASDNDCTQINTIGAGNKCVMGNCVFCVNDDECQSPEVCRTGMCVRKSEACPGTPECAAAGCTPMEISETSCPVCVCMTEYFNSCATDDDCLLISHHPFHFCVNGRCADCRNDGDCTDTGSNCLQPGICYTMAPHPSAIYGSWLIGYYGGGFNHFSYFRFEPDGTLRRGIYQEEGPAGWADDIFLFDCPAAGGESPGPLVGTWEPEITESGFLVIRIDLKAACNPEGEGLSRWLITPDETGEMITLKSVENPDSVEFFGIHLKPGTSCNSAFTQCIPPDSILF